LQCSKQRIFLNNKLRHAETPPRNVVIKTTEFWLKMAARWDGLLKTRQSGDEEGPVLPRFSRSMVLARLAAKRHRAT
jgi:hypothetical protein